MPDTDQPTDVPAPDGGNDPIARFYRASPAERRELLADGAARQALDAYFGPEVLAELAQLAGEDDSFHLAGIAPNVVFVPGIMGSLLHSATLGGVWWIDLRNLGLLDRLRLDPSGEGDLDPRDEIQPFATDFSYEGYLAAFRGRDDFAARPFPYDWRKPLAASAGRLRDTIVQMAEANGGEPVHVTAHSMGGLLVRETLRLHGDELWPLVGKVVFMASPHHGAPVMAAYLKDHLWGFDGLALLGSFLSRQTFRSLRGALQLLSAPAGVYPGTRPGGPHPCADFDLHDAAAWDLDLSPSDEADLQKALDASAAFHRELLAGHRELDQARRDRMLMIAGVGYKTIFRLERDGGLFGRSRRITKRSECDQDREGDGRVPLASATLEDVEMRYARGVHGGLPNVPAVYREVFRFLAGEPLELPTDCADVFTAHLAGEETASRTPHLDESFRAVEAAAAGAPEDDPGYLDAEPPPEGWWEEQRRRYEAGEIDLATLRGLERVKIL